MLYSFLTALSHISLFGLKGCTVPHPNFDTFPASIQTEADARALVQVNLIKGTDPKLVSVYQCDSASDIDLPQSGITGRLCSQWHNSTYDDPTHFRSLNLTDSDALMYRNFGNLKNTTRGFDLNKYYLGSSDRVVLEPTILNGLAVLPHKTGVKMVVGAPESLSKNQIVNIPKTMGVEIDIGCLSLGVFEGHFAQTENVSRQDSYDWLVLDSAYEPIQRLMFSGPEYLFEPLQRAADAVRTLILPAFENSTVGDFRRSIRQTSYGLSTQTRIHDWHPNNGTFADLTEEWSSILAECAGQVHKTVNASTPSLPVQQPPQACGFYRLETSCACKGTIQRNHIPMVCASATAINMVSATLETDGDGRINGQLSHLPSDLNIVRANVIQNQDGDYVITDDMIQRYILSDNPGGDLQHFVYQHFDNSWNGRLLFGAGTPGFGISQVGGAMVTATAHPPFSLVVDSTLVNLNMSSAQIVTEWAGGFGASYLLSTFSMNGFAALDKPPLTIRSTGGRDTHCYRMPYVVGSITLIVTALIAMLWSLHMMVASRFGMKKREVVYGRFVHRGFEVDYAGLEGGQDGQVAAPPSVNVAYEDGKSEKMTM